MIGLLVVFGGSYVLFRATPSAFLPAEDQGYFFLNLQLPNGASLERTDTVINQVTTLLRKTPGVAHVIGVAGYSIVTSAQEADGGLMIAILKPWGERGASESAAAIMNELKPKLDALPSANVSAFDPPSIPGVSATGGINYVLEAQNGESYQQLAAVSRSLILAANQNKAIGSAFSGFSDAEPQVMVQVNTDRAELLGVSPQAAYNTLQAYLGSQYVNDFNYDNFVFQVIVQADQQFRSKISDIDQLYVPSSTGAMVPITSIATVKVIQGRECAHPLQSLPERADQRRRPYWLQRTARRSRRWRRPRPSTCRRASATSGPA